MAGDVCCPTGNNQGFRFGNGIGKELLASVVIGYRRFVNSGAQAIE